MIRRVYIAMLRLHPRPFRERFAREMLWIFDQAAADRGGTARLLLDALGSLLRQWVVRPEYREQPLAAAARSSPPGVPAFVSLESARPRPGVLFQGGLLSLAAFSLVTFAIGRGGGSPPSLLFGVHFPREGLLGVERSSVEPAELTTEVRLPAQPEDPWRVLAGPYFRVILVLGALDADDDLILSPAEIAAAPTVLRKLDLDRDGGLDPQEAGQRFGDPEMVRELDPALVRRGERGFMRLHPVLAALDADRDARIAAPEIDHSPASLRTLDTNGDGSLVAREVLPDPVANEVAVYFSRLDADGDDRISADERSGGADQGMQELLDSADRDDDGAVSAEELAVEIRLRAARRQALDNAVRSALGGRRPD